MFLKFKIKFEEFVKTYGARYAKKQPREEFEAVFQEFDQDNSGSIDESELYNVVKRFNPSITRHQVDNMVSKIDRDKSGKISFDGKNRTNTNNLVIINIKFIFGCFFFKRVLWFDEQIERD